MKKLLFLLLFLPFFSYGQNIANASWTDITNTSNVSNPNCFYTVVEDKLTIRLGSNYLSCLSSDYGNGNDFYPIQQMFYCGSGTYYNWYTGQNESYPQWCLPNTPLVNTLAPGTNTEQTNWEFGAFTVVNSEYFCVGTETLLYDVHRTSGIDLKAFRLPGVNNYNDQIHLFVRNIYDTTEVYKLGTDFFNYEYDVQPLSYWPYSDTTWHYLNCDITSCNYSDSELGIFNLDSLISFTNHTFGCMDPLAANYNSNAVYNVGCCYVAGCTDSLALNYDSLACYDDGTCIFPIYGCMDSTMFNYNPLANIPTTCIPFIYGCTIAGDPNYNPFANTDDGSCTCCYGCTDSTAFNYDPIAIIDDSSCIPIIYGCIDSTAFYYDSLANTDDGSCCYIAGCTDVSSPLYNPLACIDDSSCTGFAFANFDVDTINTCGYFYYLSIDSIPHCSYVWTNSPISNPITDYQAYLDNGNFYESLLANGAVPDSTFGLSYQGGKIFHLDNNNGYVYIVANEDLTYNQTCPGYISGNPNYGGNGYSWWSSYGGSQIGFNHIFAGATDTAIGAGPANTSLAYSIASSPAASLCVNNTSGGFNDWFLPSRDELFEMYQKRSVLADGDVCLGGFDVNSFYWSSSEISQNDVWTMSFSAPNNIPAQRNKDNGGEVRPVRRSSFVPVNNINTTYLVGSSGMYYVTVTDSLGYTATDSVYLNLVNNGICGCMDPNAFNYDSLANVNDGSCFYNPGCTDSSYYNYDANADFNDGSCIPFIYGCTDLTACNFDSTANTDNGSCDTIYGCINPSALNYDSLATCADTCIFPNNTFGCTDSLSSNYNPLSTIDDGSCLPYVLGCMDSTSLAYDPLATIDDGSCSGGCMDPFASNYDSLALYDNGNCCGSYLDWQQIGSAIIGDVAYEYLGGAVSLSANGKVFAVGSGDRNQCGTLGKVKIYNVVGNSLAQIGNTLIGPQICDRFGISISLNSLGNIVVVGAPHFDVTVNDHQGLVRVYKNISGNWTQLGSDFYGDSGDELGHSVSISDDGFTIAIGSPKKHVGGIIQAGQVKVFHFDTISNNWLQIGQSIDGIYSYGRRGWAVSLNGNGDILALSSPHANGPEEGQSSIYAFDGSSWNQLGQTIDPPFSSGSFGWSSALSNDGSTVVIGSDRYPSGNYDGCVLVYDFDGAYWNQKGSLITTSISQAHLGTSVSINSNGEKIVVGAPDAYSNDGYVETFEFKNNDWFSYGDTIRGYSGGRMGKAVCMSDDGLNIAAGSTYKQIGSQTQSGSAYLYKRIDPCYGCTDPIALNYDQFSLIDDGSCLYIDGCNDPSATNFDPLATKNDGSCCYSQSFGSTIGQKIFGTGNYQELGRSLAVSGDGNVLVIGSPDDNTQNNTAGKVDIYFSNNSVFNPDWILLQTFYGNSDMGRFGYDVDVNYDGSRIIIGEYGINSQRGEIHTYDYNGIDYSFIGGLTGDYSDDRFGRSVSINRDGSRIAVGADGYDGHITGSHLGQIGWVKIYEYFPASSPPWQQIGNGILGDNSSDYMGWSVSLDDDGNTIIVGAPGDQGGSQSGFAKVFEFDGVNWNQLGNKFSGVNNTDRTGQKVEISEDGNTIIIGSPQYDNGVSNEGKVEIYDWDGTSWNQKGNTLYGYTDQAYFGSSLQIGLNGNTIAVGSPSSNNFNYFAYGNKVSIYDFVSSNWQLRSYSITDSSDYSEFGYDIAVDQNFSKLFVSNPWYGSYHINGGSHYYQYGSVDIYNIGSSCVLGCTDNLALNYDSTSTADDGSCCYIAGCIDSTAFNYDSLACFDDGSCIATIFGCLDTLAYNYDSLANTDDGSCMYCDLTNSFFITPNSPGNCDGLIISTGISSNQPINYLWNNGSTMSFLTSLCAGIYVVELTDNVGCYLSDTVFMNVIFGCTDSTAFNYNPLATNDDGSCIAAVYGCTDSLAYNYNSFANTDDGSCCFISGCTDSTSFNYDSLACYDDGSCIPFIYGCLDTLAYNYDALANTDDGSCMYCDLTNSFFITSNTPGNCDGFVFSISTSTNTPITYLWSNGSTQSNLFGLCQGIYTVIITDAVGCVIEDTALVGLISGCTDSTSSNYNPLANIDDGSCIPCIYGCMDSLACNYDSLATCDDGSCLTVYGCMDSTAFNYDPLATCDDGSCIPFVYGCTDSLALNYNPLANTDDGSCLYCVYGCMDSTALNYDPLATCDDGSCQYPSNCTSPKPTGLYSFDVIDTRAKVGWDNMNDPDCMVWKYFVRYREVGTSQWTTKSAGVGNGLCNFGLNTITKQLLNLNPSTTYEFRMKAFYCGGTSSNYSTPVQFTTADPCPDMTNLTATTFNGNQAKVRFNWDTTGVYTFARILLRVDTAGANWQTAGGFGVYYPTFFVNKFGLQPGESYRAQGRTFCDSNITAYRSPTWTTPTYWTQPGTIRTNGGSSINNLDIYPNPSRDVFNISFNSNEIQDLGIRIINVVGAEVYREDRENFVGEYTKQVSLDNYGKGIYFLEIETNTGIVNKKLILQ